MNEEREVRPGWLPPKAPAAVPGPAQAAPARPTFVPARRHDADAPSSPFAVVAIVMAVLSLVLLVLSVGVGWGVSSLLSMMAMGIALTARQRLRAGGPGRESQIRTAMVFAIVSLAAAAVAAAIWLGLQSNGVTPQDLQDWLERELERRRAKTTG